MGLGGFASPWLLAGMGLLAVPILIHLLFRLRYRTVRFAAMEFLRESQRRHRRRIWWEQLLLLLLRCALVALLVLAVARPRAEGTLAALLGRGGTTEHWIVWDDSASMGRQVGGRSLFEQSKERIRRLWDELARSPGRHVVSVLLTSHPGTPLIDRVVIDSNSAKSLAPSLEATPLSWSSLSPAESLRHIADRLSSLAPSILHVFSDFTEKDWSRSTGWIDLARRLDRAGASLRLIDLATSEGDNVGIVKLSPRRAAPAAGIPLTIDVSVKNFSKQSSSRRTVTPKLGDQSLPSRLIESLSPGETVSVSFEFVAPSAGVSDLAVRIDNDSLPADDVRYLAIETPSAIPVLIVDDQPSRRDATYLSLALAPGGDAATGISPTIRTSAEAAAIDLSEYRAVYLLNVARFESAWARKLRTYVEGGGGLALFVGDQVDPAHYNQVLGGPDIGLLPAPLVNRKRPAETTPDEIGDLRPQPHPLFELFEGQRNSFLQTVTIEEFITLDETKISPKSLIVARHRDRSAIWIDTPVGAGRVLLSLTTAGDAWTSWPQNPSYVVCMLSLQDYLASHPTENEGLIGNEWNLTWNLTDFRPELQMIRPTAGTIERLSATIEGSQATFTLKDANDPGVYRITQTRIDGSTRPIGYSFNLDPREGDLTKVTPSSWKNDLEGLKVEYINSREQGEETGPRSLEAKDLIIGLLLLVLLGEQALGYRLGFHRRESA
jgi:hypothetical protein